MSTAAALNKGPVVRRFLNIVMKKFGGGSGSVYSVSRIDPIDHLFYPSAAEALAAAARPAPWLERIQLLPPPKVKLQAYRSDDMRLDFLPFYGGSDGGDSRILCTDPAGSTVLSDASDGSIEPVPRLSEPKGPSPVSFSVFLGDSAYAVDPKRADALYVLDRCPASRSPCSFEVLIYKTEDWSGICWQWHQLPPPPYVNDPDHEFGAIQSYALLDGGTTLCVSCAPVGTYCFNTATREWIKAGRWTLPFDGRAHHVPELDNLWFGLAGGRFCALNLGRVDRKAPQLLHQWHDLDLPEGWVQTKGSLVYLGGGRFCITRIFDTGDTKGAVVAGVEVMHGGPCELQMIKHKSFISDEIQCVL